MDKFHFTLVVSKLIISTIIKNKLVMMVCLPSCNIDRLIYI